MASYSTGLFAPGTQPLTATRATSPALSAGAKTATQTYTSGTKSLMPGATIPAGAASALAAKPQPTSPLAPSGYVAPTTKPQATIPRPPNPAVQAGLAGMSPPTSGPLASPTSQAPLQAPGNNLTNPGYGEQALELTQNRLLEDPAAGQLQTQYNAANTPTQGQNYMNQNLGTLDGAGQGDQYWNQVQGQFNDPFAGEQFARQATQNFSPTGAAGAFNTGAQARSDQFTNFQGAGNSQQQLGQSQQQLQGGTQGEHGLGDIAGDYGAKGTYTDPNLAAGQYSQTQQAFGDLPIAEFDPFYDRARQLGVQSYNRDAAGRGVYGSSEALSGVGNIITDIEAQRANRSFDAEMQRTQEQRARQQLLGEQARSGDQSSLEAFNQNLQGAQTFGNINRDLASTALDRTRVLGDLAGQADTQALGAQNANISGLNTLGNAASAADTAETNRYQASTSAMNNADRTGLDRLNSGVSNSLAVDANNRGDFQASQSAAASAAGLDQSGTRLAADIADRASGNDLDRLNAFNDTAQGAEAQRQSRQMAKVTAGMNLSAQVQSALGNAGASAGKYDADAFDSWVNAEIAPALQDASLSREQKKALMDGLRETFDAAHDLAD